jgi:hypothetical protein
MAGPQDYLTVKGPEGASYSLPKFDLGSQIASIPTSYQEGQKAAQANEQYARTRAIQTALPNGIDEFKDPQTGQYDMHGLVNRMVQVAGPEGAGMAQQLMDAALGSQVTTKVQGELGGGTGRPMAPPVASGPGNIDLSKQPMAPDGATDNSGAETVRTLATGIAKGQDATAAINRIAGRYGGPDAPLSPAQEADARSILGRLIGQGGQQPGTGRSGQPAPFAANRTAQPASDQQNAPPNPQPTFNARVPQYGGMSNRPSVTQDGTSQPPTAATSSREVAQNGPGVVSPTPSSGTPSRYQYLQEQANQKRQEAQTWALAGPKYKDRADLLNKQADALDERAKQDPQYIANVEGARNESTAQVKLLSELADSGVESKGQIGQLNVIKQLGDKVGFGVVPKVQSFLGKYGVDTNGLTDIQAYERAIDYMAPQLRPIGSGRLMQQELAAFKSSLGGLMTTPEGRRISLENLGLIANYKTQIGQIAADTTLSPSERIQKVYSVAPPHLKTEAPVSSQPGQTQATGQPGAQPPKITSKSDFDKLKSGTSFIDKDGVRWRKP